MESEATVWQVMSRRVLVSRTGIVTHEHCVAVCVTRALAVEWVGKRVDRESRWGEIPHDERGAYFIVEGPQLAGLVPG